MRPLSESQSYPPQNLGPGALVPPELFPRIIHWVSLLDFGVEAHEKILRDNNGSAEGVDPEEFIRASKEPGPTYMLCICSLVCLYWANRCREYIFTRAILDIASREDAMAFRRYTVDCSPNLIPIYTLIRGLKAWMPYHSILQPSDSDHIVPRKSFLDLLYLPQTRNKLESLVIRGPTPSAFPPSILNTPHWSIPSNAQPPPEATSYEDITMTCMSFPSYRHLIGYFKYFSGVTSFDLFKITWDSDPETLNNLVLLKRGPVRRRQSLVVSTGLCTDDLHLCLQIAMMYPDFPLRQTSPQEQAWAIDLMRYVHDCHRVVPKWPTNDGDELRCNIWPRRS